MTTISFHICLMRIDHTIPDWYGSYQAGTKSSEYRFANRNLHCAPKLLTMRRKKQDGCVVKIMIFKAAQVNIFFSN